jgi:hypothetical protein
MSKADLHDEFDPYVPPKADLRTETFEGVKTRGIDPSVENPFLTIWLRPRATIRGIVDTSPSYLVIPLAMGGGVIQALSRAVQRNAGDQLSLRTLLILVVIFGAIGGLIGLYIGGALVAWAGRRLRGTGTSEQVRAALAWSQVPMLATTPLWILQLALIGDEMFKSDTPRLDANEGNAIVLWVTGMMEIVLGVWGIVTALKCVGEVHQFSAWRALGSILLLILIYVVPLSIILLLIIMAHG